MSRRKKLPKYRLHKPSGQAVVTLSGRDIYLLGAHDTEVSRVEYDRLVAEWLVNGRTWPSDPLDDAGLTVARRPTAPENGATGGRQRSSKK